MRTTIILMMIITVTDVSISHEFSIPKYAGNCYTIGPHCADADILIACDRSTSGSYVQKQAINCAALAKGYCCNNDTKSCSKTCGNAGVFMCVQPGFFPNPNNCNKFFYCSSTSLIPIIGDCGSEIYDITSHTCISVSKQETTTPKNKRIVVKQEDIIASMCEANSLPKDFDCRNLSPPTAFNDSHYFAFCLSPDGAYTIQKCQESYHFSKNNTCVFACDKVGRFVNEFNKHGFWNCDDLGKDPDFILCQSNEIFDPDLKTCIETKLVENKSPII